MYGTHTWEFPKIRVPYLRVLIIGILVFSVLYWGPLFTETPTWLPFVLSDICIKPRSRHWEDLSLAAMPIRVLVAVLGGDGAVVVAEEVS